MGKKKPVKIGIKRTVILYKCHIEDDPISLSIKEQTKMCDDYLKEKKLLAGKQYVEYLDTEGEDYECRPGLMLMFKELEQYNLEECIIVMASVRVLGKNIRPNSNIIGYIRRKKHSLYIIERNDFIESAHNIFYVHLSIAAAGYIEELLSEIFYVFTKKDGSNKRMFKGAIKTLDDLRNILVEKCGDDTHLEITCAGNMNRSWSYSFSEGRKIFDEVENIIDLFSR